MHFKIFMNLTKWKFVSLNNLFRILHVILDIICIVLLDHSVSHNCVKIRGLLI